MVAVLGAFAAGVSGVAAWLAKRVFETRHQLQVTKANRDAQVAAAASQETEAARELERIRQTVQNETVETYRTLLSDMRDEFQRRIDQLETKIAAQQQEISRLRGYLDSPLECEQCGHVMSPFQAAGPQGGIA